MTVPILRLTCCTVLVTCATAARFEIAPSSDCLKNPSICYLNQTCEHTMVNTQPVSGHCVDIPDRPDCYRFPDSCPENQWCMMQDHTSWEHFDYGTRGMCVSYQTLCQSCQVCAKLEGTLGTTLAGLSGIGMGFANDKEEWGEYHERQLICDPQHYACTGETIPGTPPTCVFKRQLDRKPDISAAQLLEWTQRLLRSGARTFDPGNPQDERGVDASWQQPQGCSREELHHGVNEIVEALWPAAQLGAFPGAQRPENKLGGEELKCCHWDNYTEVELNGYQRERGRAEYRNPIDPDHPVMGNPKPCVWCKFDGAFNDENPSTWSLIHALTFNLPSSLSEKQYGVLRALPLFLREHLSCSLCRSHIREHLIHLGIPESRNGREWAEFFWRAHNFVNEQSQVTRCGSQSCNWGSWHDPAADHACNAVYRFPWFMTFSFAEKLWTIDEPCCRQDPNDPSQLAWS